MRTKVPSETRPSTVASRDDRPIAISIETSEDIAEELEDFVYLARLGCINEANILYDLVLRKHLDYCFPIMAEHIDMLLSNACYEEAFVKLQRYIYHDFTDQHREENDTLMEAMLDYVRTRLQMEDNKPVSLSRATPLPRMTQILRDASVTKVFETIEYHTLEIVLTKNVLLAPRHVRVRFTEMCPMLIDLSRYWEAQSLLDLSVKGSPDLLIAYQFFICFFECITPHLSFQPAKIAQLVALLQYLTFIRQCQRLDKNEIVQNFGEKTAERVIQMPQRAIDDAEELLIYFFEDLSTAKGRLFEEWVNLATYFVDKERDKLVAERIQEDEMDMSGSTDVVKGKSEKLPLPVPQRPTLSSMDQMAHKLGLVKSSNSAVTAADTRASQLGRKAVSGRIKPMAGTSNLDQNTPK